MSVVGFNPFGNTVPAIYNSYVEDPKWANKFTYAWVSVLGAIVLCSVPALVSAVRRGSAFEGFFGVREDWSTPSSDKPAQSAHIPASKKGRLYGGLSSAFSLLRYTVPFVELDIGQLFVIGGYLAALIVCIVKDAPLLTNSNRAGFLALAQLPVVFLFATKNSALSFLIGSGYEKLNWVHKIAGRGLFIAVAVHGSLWIRDRLIYHETILGAAKTATGVVGFAMLCVIILTTLRPFRERFYQSFFIIHVLMFTTFFVIVCVHTPYSAPWIYPPVALYGADLLMRLIRFRIKDATLVAPDSQMTLIHVHDAHTGFRAGQHVRLRVFAGGLVFQSHPLTILAAPSHTSVLPASVVPPGSLALGARSVGDWSRAVNALARSTSTPDAACEATPLIAGDGTPVTVMLDGPYGGLALDLGTHEHVLLLAGGSGLTFALGVLDDLVGRIARHGRAGGEVTRRVELAWCIRSFGAIYWFAPHLQALARAVEQTPGLTLHIAVYVTCLCDPEAVPDIPNSVVTVERPDARRMLGTFLAGADLGPGCSVGSLESAEAVEVGPTKGSPEMSEKDVPVLEHGAGAGVTGGVALCVAGPESLCRGAANAVAIMGAREGVRVGGISFHSEVYAL